MGTHPLNLMFRFILEVIALISVGMWGWKLTTSGWRLILVILIPLSLALIWGTFNVPGDPSRSGEAPVVVSGLLRLVLELFIFFLASAAIFQLGHPNHCWLFAGLVLMHYALSYDRLTWLLAR